MGVVLKWSVVLAVLVTILSLAIGGTGMHKNPIVGGIVSIALAIVINAAVIFLALRQTAPSSGYGRQLVNGALIGLVGGALIFLSSMALLTVVFPQYLDEMKAGVAAFLEASGVPEEVRQQQIQAMDQTTPASQSASAFIGTFFTSVVVAAIVGIFTRRK